MGNVMAIAELDVACAQSYKHGFWILANVRINGNDQFYNNIASTEYQLTLLNNTLALWAKRPPKSVVVSLDGVTLASGGLPDSCSPRSHATLGDSKDDPPLSSEWLPMKHAALCRTVGTAPVPKAWHSCPLRDELSDLGEGTSEQCRSETVSAMYSQLVTLKQQLKAARKCNSTLEAATLEQRLKEAEDRAGQAEETYAVEAAALETTSDQAQQGDNAKEEEKAVQVAATMAHIKHMMSQREKKEEVTQASAKRWLQQQAKILQGPEMKGCQLLRNKVDIHQQGFPTNSVIDRSNMVIMGNTLQTRVCALHGVIEFTAMENGVLAQLDPNLRDPKLKTPLCFPIAAMMFFASAIPDHSDHSWPMSKIVAIQIEPQGTMRIIGGDPEVIAVQQNKKVRVRLDGITYAPFMPFNEPYERGGQGCTPSCFPPNSITTGATMGISGCIKYCNPGRSKKAREPRYPNIDEGDCQFDVVKRLECSMREGNPDLQCGQFKQLVRTWTYSKESPTKCAETCARQLSNA